MREEHRRGMRDEGWGGPRPGGPEWGPRPGRGSGRYGGERGRLPRRARRPRLGSWRPRAPRRPGGRRWGGEATGMPGLRPWRPWRGPWRPWRRRPVGPARLRPRQRVSARATCGPRSSTCSPRKRAGWNGYQLIQEIPARTDGVWRPSAGSVYPALQQLEDEGLIAPEGEGRRRMYSLTDAGRTYAEEHADELSASWDAAAGMTDEDAIEFSEPDPPGHDGGHGGAAGGDRRPAGPGPCRAGAGPQLAVPDPGRGRARHGGR